jgi:hypothetical protein
MGSGLASRPLEKPARPRTPRGRAPRASPGLVEALEHDIKCAAVGVQEGRRVSVPGFDARLLVPALLPHTHKMEGRS